MPELTEEMYCHQQICIPPTFPYLLRQYAKAAIRSQPTDLLKWSTAYFRCLSLNVPPPVKPRLEYPIPRDYVGITPGWLRALNYQLQNNLTVPFKILWDRWIGACLQHDTLIKILCLGGFTDPNAIPWNRFLGLCAGHLTDNLTQTMIMLCEILTEEPEGGSAMIPLETFLDVYKFLAAIDASQPQTLINLYFTDDALNLYEKEKKKKLKMALSESTPTEELSTATPEEVAEEQEAQLEIIGEGSIISCPDITSDDALQEPELDEDKRSEKSDEIIDITKSDEDDSNLDDDDDMKLLSEEKYDLDQKPSDEIDKLDKEGSLATSEEPVKSETATQEEQELLQQMGEEEFEGREARPSTAVTPEQAEHEDDYDDEPEEGKEPMSEIAAKAEDEEESLKGFDTEDDRKRKSTVEEQLKLVEKDIFEKGGLVLEEELQEEELEGVDLKMEMPREQAFEIGKEDIIETPGEGGFYPEIDELEEHIRMKYGEATAGEEETVQEEALEEEEPPEEVQVDAIPGIGPIVPQELVDAVVRYLTTVSAEEHGMTMPRHVRHYNCPPLEVQE